MVGGLRSSGRGFPKALSMVPAPPPGQLNHEVGPVPARPWAQSPSAPQLQQLQHSRGSMGELEWWRAGAKSQQCPGLGGSPWLCCSLRGWHRLGIPPWLCQCSPGGWGGLRWGLRCAVGLLQPGELGQRASGCCGSWWQLGLWILFVLRAAQCTPSLGQSPFRRVAPLDEQPGWPWHQRGLPVRAKQPAGAGTALAPALMATLAAAAWGAPALSIIWWVLSAATLPGRGAGT